MNAAYYNFSKLCNEDIDAIREGIANSLARLGIFCNVILNMTIDRFDRPFMTITSSGFNTTPVIYKNVDIKGYAITNIKDEERNIYTLSIHLDYHFTYFSGGENGVDIGDVEFRIFDDNEDGNKIRFVRFVIAR